MTDKLPYQNRVSCYRKECHKSPKQYGKHNKINREYAFGKSHNHINGIEGFWSYAKERFHKYHGINMTNYPLYLKEMEFRFNHRNEDVFKLLVNITKGGNLVRK